MAILAASTRHRNTAKFGTSTEVAALCGVCFLTINRLCDSGQIEHHKTEGGHRRVNVVSAMEYFGLAVPASEGDTEGDTEGKTVCYSRVSTQRQHTEGNLERQAARLASYCQEHYPGEKVLSLSDVGSGLSDDRRGFNKLLDMILAGEVRRVVCEYGDRLHRSSRKLVFRLAEKCGVEIVETRTGDKEREEETPEQEMASDIKALFTCYIARVHGRRGGEATAVVFPEGLKERVATLYASGLSQRDIGKQVVSEGRWKCQNTGNPITSWAVHRLCREVKESCEKAEVERLPESVRKFIKAACVVSRAKQVFAPPLYQTYRLFCEKAGMEAATDKSFCLVLRENGFKYEKQATGKNLVYGLALKGNKQASQSKKRWEVSLPV